MLNLAVGFNLILLSWGYQSQKNMSSKSNIAYIFAKPSIANLSTSFPAAPASHLWPRNLSVFSVHSEGHFAAPGHMMANNLPKGFEPKKTSRGKYGSHWLVLAGSWKKNKHHKDFVEIFVASVRVCQWETCIPAFHGNMFRSIAIEGCMGLWHVSGFLAKRWITKLSQKGGKNTTNNQPIRRTHNKTRTKSTARPSETSILSLETVGRPWLGFVFLRYHHGNYCKYQHKRSYFGIWRHKINSGWKSTSIRNCIAKHRSVLKMINI